MAAVIPFAGCFISEPKTLQQGDLVFLGLPDDSKSSYLRGSAQGAEVIRRAYDGNCYNSTTETGVDLANMVIDRGDLLSKKSWDETAEFYTQSLREIFALGAIPFSAGGDHAVTIPIIAALDALGEKVHVIQIDAHPDLYPDYEGDLFSHACTGARILEMAHIASLTQIGIRAMNRPQREFAAQFKDKYHLFEAKDIGPDLPELMHIPTNAPVYITLDLDAFDPAFAPGVAHLVPGGLTPRAVLNFLQHGTWKLIGMDAVEVNPERDVNHQTAVLAGRMLHEAMGCVFNRRKL